MPKEPSLADLVRKAVKQDDRSRYALAKEAGMSLSTLQRFVSGESDLTSEKIGPLMRVLGFTITMPKR